MKLPDMYNSIIVVLSLLVLLNGYFLGILPLAVASVLVAVLVAVVLEALIEYFKTKKFIFSRSPVVSGLIIGSIAQPGSWLLIAGAAIVAVVAKKLITKNKMPVFNPAASGLFAMFALSGGTGEVWWANGTGLLLPTIAIIVLGLFVSWKVRKLYISIPYLLAFVAITALTAHPSADPLVFLPFFSAFFMLTEPKTSPNTRNHQIVFGVLVAVLMHALGIWNLPSAFLLGLLVANLVGKLVLK